MKNKSKIRQNWLRQERNSKGHFMPYKELPTKTYPISLLDDLKETTKQTEINEPPCGWEKLQSLFIQKSSYLLTSDWDDRDNEFASLAQLISYGESAIRECVKIKNHAKQDQQIDLNAIEHAFLSGLKANNSFYPPSKLWEFYKRDRGL